jgi:hypothetical protein
VTTLKPTLPFFPWQSSDMEVCTISFASQQVVQVQPQDLPGSKADRSWPLILVALSRGFPALTRFSLIFHAFPLWPILGRQWRYKHITTPLVGEDLKHVKSEITLITFLRSPRKKRWKGETRTREVGGWLGGCYVFVQYCKSKCLTVSFWLSC